MKRKILAAAIAAAASGGAFAQSNVTVYGILDYYMGHISTQGQESLNALDNGGLQASRIGFRGTEDLGNGLKVNFTLENGIVADTGATADSARLFNRQSWLGLTTASYGEVRVGRQNSPAFYMLGNLDPFAGATYASFLNNVTGYVPRYDNLIGYLSPELFGGLKLQAYYAPGEQVSSSAKHGLNNYLYAAEYKTGPLYLGLNHAHRISADATFAVQETFLGGSYDYGMGKVYLAGYRGNNFGSNTTSAASGGVAANTRGSFIDASAIGVDYRVSPVFTLAAGYGKSTGDKSGNNAKQWSFAGFYDLSKRTKVYATVAKLDNDNGATFSLGAAGPGTNRNAPTVAGRDTTGYQLGIRHSF